MKVSAELNVGKSDKASTVKHERERWIAPLGFPMTACQTLVRIPTEAARITAEGLRGLTPSFLKAKCYDTVCDMTPESRNSGARVDDRSQATTR
jgi:hypothetical protein